MGSKKIFSGIYKIISLSMPDRCYVGSAVNLNKRKAQHFRLLLKNTHHSIKLQNHYNKYGKNDLEFCIIELCSVDNLIIREQCFIDLLNPCFNICMVAGSVLGRKHKEETKRKIGNSNSISLLGLKQSPSQIENTRTRMYGNKHALGYSHTEEAIRKITTSMKKRVITEDHRENLSISKRKAIIQYDKNGVFIKEYSWAREACIQNGFKTERHIKLCARGKIKTAYGFIWKFKI